MGYSLLEKDYDEVDLKAPLEVDLQQTYESAPVVDEDDYFDLFAINWSCQDKNVIVEQLML